MILTSLLLAAAPLTVEGTDEARPDLKPAERRAVEILRESREATATDRTPFVTSISKEAKDAFPVLIDLLASGRVPAVEASEQMQRLSSLQREILLESLSRSPSTALTAEADRRIAGEDASVEDFALAICLRSLTGEPGQVEVVARLVLDGTGEKLADPPEALARAYEEALERLFRNDSRSLESLGVLKRRNYEPLYPSTVRAIGAARAARGCATLLWIAQRAPDLRKLVFGQLRKTGPSHDEAVDRGLVELTLDFMRGKPDRDIRSAIVVLGEFGHESAVEGLIELLERGGGIAEDALWSLREITGLGFTADPLRWRFWHENEKRWFEQEFESTVAALHGRKPAASVAAIRELATHHLRRHAVAVELATALQVAPVERQPMICAALQVLGSERALPVLSTLLGGDEGRPKTSAHAAMVAITGLDLPPDPRPWRDALNENYSHLGSW